jgi:phosphoribosylaminoimidazolecarboxamide formyltransferase/IMP cyclohydrolase
MTAKRALFSVYDKTDIVPFARGLIDDLGFEIVSTGGTAKAFEDAKLEFTSVESITGFPAMLDDRVKTLHPKIHAAILADQNNPEHMAQLAQLDIEPFGLVVVNLYPFASEPSIKQIDVGGPTMIRGAAKNYQSVGAVIDPEDYDVILEELRENDGNLSIETRLSLAATVFDLTAGYDDDISRWLWKQRNEGNTP